MLLPKTTLVSKWIGGGESYQMISRSSEVLIDIAGWVALYSSVGICSNGVAICCLLFVSSARGYCLDPDHVTLLTKYLP